MRFEATSRHSPHPNRNIEHEQAKVDTRPSAGRQPAEWLARLHNDYMSALWRGEDVSAVSAWLEAHWSLVGPQEPVHAPEAISLFGGRGYGGGIRWYQRGATIFGYPPGLGKGCYRISVEEIPFDARASLEAVAAGC